MLLKELFAAAALALTVWLFWPYIQSIRNGTTRPHVFSWVIWAFGTAVVFLAQLEGGAGVGAWPLGFSASVSGYVAWLAWRARADVSITRTDWLFLIGALSAIPLWIITADPLWAVVILTGIDLAGFGPTLRKSYHDPHSEHAGFYGIGSVRNALLVLALENYTLTTVLFPAAVGVACAMVCALLLMRRSTLAE